MLNSRTGGFTLIEVMLAMAITAMLGVIAYNCLSVSMTAAQTNETQAKRLANIQSALTLMERDIRHAALRGITDHYGDAQPAMLGGEFEEYVLQLTRFGWGNPQNQQRGEVQRVRYRLSDGNLWREYWPVLDLIDEEQGLQSLLLLEGVTELSFQFLNDRSSGADQSPIGGEWQDQWSPVAEEDRLPRAIEFSFKVAQFGQIKRVIEVVGS